VHAEPDAAGYHSGRRESPRADPSQALAAQRGRDGLARHPRAGGTQIGQDACGAVDAVGGLVEVGDLGVQLDTPLPRRRRAAVAGSAPFVEPRP
jgi:hypothetical protein